jgi:hypothetical protein
VPSYNLLSKLLLKHNSHSSFLPKLLLIITLTNTSSIIRIRQTKHIKNKTKAITRTEVFREALKAVVASEAIAVSAEVKTVTNITYYLHIKKSVISITSQITSQQSTLLKSKNKHITSSVNIPLVFIRHSQLYIIKAF